MTADAVVDYLADGCMRSRGKENSGPTSVAPRADDRRWWHELVVVAICLAATVVMTWPVARVFTTRFCGGLGDPQLTLWSMRWMRDALAALQNPFFTPRLYHPHGTTLVFHTFDLPSTLMVLPLWGWLPEPAIYNTAVLFAFALTAYGMARLARELTGDALSGVLAGLVFAGVPYHYAHLRGHLHLVSMGWVPLYVVHLLRIVDDRGRTRDAVLAGVFLALASLASWYHLLFAAVISVPLVLAGSWCRHGRAGVDRMFRQCVVVALAWGVLAGPLLAAMVVMLRREPILGAHDPLSFSADASSFFDRGSMALVAKGEHATYAGFTVVALALLGAIRDRRARPFLVVAVVGALLTLGPVLQWRGASFDWPTPYGWLERVPGFSFSGVPVRLGYVMYFGLVVAAAFGLAALRRLVAPDALARVIVVVVAIIALREYWAGPAVTSECPVPAPIRAWAADDRPWAVLDVSGGWSEMWHATLHRKPIIGGYVGRVPKRVEDWLVRQPVLASIASPDGWSVLSRVDRQIDLTPSAGDLVGDRFSADWHGSLIAPSTGVYTFRVAAPADAVLDVNRVTVVRMFPSQGGGDPARAQVGRAQMKAGAHTLQLRAFDVPRGAAISLSWAPPGQALEVVPEDALRTAGGVPGLDAEFIQHIPVLSGLGRVPGRAALRALSIRYVVTADAANPCVEDELALPLTYRGEGVRIYEVPAGDD